MQQRLRPFFASRPPVHGRAERPLDAPGRKSSAAAAVRGSPGVSSLGGAGEGKARGAAGKPNRHLVVQYTCMPCSYLLENICNPFLPSMSRPVEHKARPGQARPPLSGERGGLAKGVCTGATCSDCGAHCASAQALSRLTPQQALHREAPRRLRQQHPQVRGYIPKKGSAAYAIIVSMFLCVFFLAPIRIGKVDIYKSFVS